MNCTALRALQSGVEDAMKALEKDREIVTFKEHGSSLTLWRDGDHYIAPWGVQYAQIDLIEIGSDYLKFVFSGHNRSAYCRIRISNLSQIIIGGVIVWMS